MLTVGLALVATVAVAGGLRYLTWYGGIAGPIDWLMRTHRHAARDRRAVALTFDDGPDPSRTPALLDALAELEVEATFFCVGAEVDAHPALARRIARDGHELGNHTYTHRYLPLARSRAVGRELAAADAALVRATGAAPVIARPPYGGRAMRTARAFARHGKRMVLWDVNSYDWKGAPAAEVAARVLARVRPGSVVLLHDGGRRGADTVAAVRLLVPALRAQGYALATVSKLFGA
jgi:peptidoglycan-N-acetylglucosamine deacetylase